MKEFFPQPYRLYNKIQNYDWGSKNENAFIPKLLGIEAEPELPYGELWIGAHPKAPSEIEINGIRIPLNDAVKSYSLEILGKYAAEKFNGQFPFLLKVLSAARALSIQLHPNKAQAVKLHAKDPKNYPDDNHKPEIAIAVDSLTAVAGFKPVEQIVNDLKRLPELELIVGKEFLDEIIFSNNNNEAKKLVKILYSSIMVMSDDKETLIACISKINKRLKAEPQLSEEEKQFLTQYETYGNDVGLLSFFFFNIIHLQTNQAIFTDAGVPHAYIKGNIIECMANSDNVVRAGLTSKFKDVETLLEIVNYDFREVKILNNSADNDEVIFKTSAQEFQVSMFEKAAGCDRMYLSKDKPSVMLVANGVIEIFYKVIEESKSQIFRKGESFLIPACLKEYSIKVIQASKFYIVNIPD